MTDLTVVLAAAVGATPPLLIAVLQRRESERAATRQYDLDRAEVARRQKDESKWFKSERYPRLVGAAMAYEKVLRLGPREFEAERNEEALSRVEEEIVATRLFDPEAVGNATDPIQAIVDETRQMVPRHAEAAPDIDRAQRLLEATQRLIAAMRDDLSNHEGPSASRTQIP